MVNVATTAAKPSIAAYGDYSRAHVLSAFIGGGLFFMLLPGTFLGVLNLIQISGRESAALVSSSWIQAHGHAQIFGWVGSFILGIGFYSIPRSSHDASMPRGAWLSWTLWTLGVALRWVTNVYEIQWRVLLPLSAALELAAFLVFVRAVSGHRPPRSGHRRFEPWTWIVMAGTAGFLLTLIGNLGTAVYAARTGETPALPHALDQRFLTLVAWGFLAPFVWGFSARWMPALLGLRATHTRVLLLALACAWTGIALTLAGYLPAASVALIACVVAVIVALRLFEPTMHAAKTRGVHRSFPVFIRTAYAWLVVAAALGAAAVRWDVSGGIWGASRHAFTVGFVSIMVFSVGQRVLPAFAGARALWSPALMVAGLLLLTSGCALRVTAEVLAYQRYVTWAWPLLPVSAFLELGAVTIFATNMTATFVLNMNPDPTSGA